MSFADDRIMKKALISGEWELWELDALLQLHDCTSKNGTCEACLFYDDEQMHLLSMKHQEPEGDQEWAGNYTEGEPF
jgi:hypothetical protein